MVVMAPVDERECRMMLQSALEYPGPALVRYPRGSGPGTLPDQTLETLPIGEGAQVRTGRGVAILAFGSMLARAITVAETLDATVANMRFVKPLDTGLVERLAAGHELLVTIEENVVQGGAGSAVNELLAQRQTPVKVLNLGLPDRYIEHASCDEQLQEAGLDVDTILSSIKAALSG
jgi:1-deoxy-D-xylulose-5-phosphate synthase